MFCRSLNAAALETQPRLANLGHGRQDAEPGSSNRGTPALKSQLPRTEPGRAPPPHSEANSSSVTSTFQFSPHDIPILLDVESELLRDTSLLEQCVCSVSGKYLVVDRKAPPGDWAEPDFVVSAAGAFERAPVCPKDFFKLWRVAGHQEAKTPLSSC